MRIGIVVPGVEAPAALSGIRAAEAAGVPAVWMTSGGAAPDPLAIYAAAATETERIVFGTSIIQTFPRHPLTVAQSALVVEQLAPERLRLGVGPSGPMVIEQVFGLPYVRPLEHLREYVTILRELFQRGEVAFQGNRLGAHARLPGPLPIPVLTSALRRGAYRLAGETADGAISWLCPFEYLRDVARPALEEGAQHAGRETPPLVGHVVVSVNSDATSAREAIRRAFGFFARISAYQAMFGDAGFPEAAEGEFSDRLIDALSIHGDLLEVEVGLERLPDYGIDEAMVTIVPDPRDVESTSRALELLGRMSDG